jgi:hypothetical protein
VFRPRLAAAVLLAAVSLNGCTGGIEEGAASPRPSRAVAVDDSGSDVGNGRPQVTHDGLMVRRRVVIAVHSAATADLATVRTELDVAAAHRHTRLSDISASVLDPAVLERLAPDLVVALPAGTSRATAAELLAPSSPDGRRLVDAAQAYDVVPVLVHDLRFSVHTARPAALSRAIAREGILSDALGNYTTTLGSSTLAVTYTGPLLSDLLVESVRTGIARPAHVTPAAVIVSPRSTTGTGVDLAREPAPEPVVPTASPGHHHQAAGPPTAADGQVTAPGRPSSPTSAHAHLLVGAVVLLLLVALCRFFTVTLGPPPDAE